MLTAQLLELLDTCSSDLQRDIIKFLPEIVTDEHHAVRPTHAFRMPCVFQVAKADGDAVKEACLVHELICWEALNMSNSDEVVRSCRPFWTSCLACARPMSRSCCRRWRRCPCCALTTSCRHGIAHVEFASCLLVHVAVLRARHAVQDAVVGMAIDRLDSVAVADLPAVLHFVLVHADCQRRQACSACLA